ncbi:MAG: aspartate aminotransferase [Acidiferrobacteraceae bacterium]|nr:aspartate aminotransferase [Acidiferrobacteraceae bacterium]|tara:strand:+ start:5654 stop:6811 length:1158 start_codon:yes stop_codon:yes gene_type:complete
MLRELRRTIEEMPISQIREIANDAIGLEDMIPLWFGEPDIATPDFIYNTAIEAMKAGHTFYTPNRGIPELRDAISSYTKQLYNIPIDPDRVTVTASGMSGIMISNQLLVEPGTNVVCPVPLWPNIRGTIDILGGEFRAVPLRLINKSWELDLDQLFQSVDQQTRAIFINSPNNPTGWIMSSDQQQALLKFCRDRGLWLIADEVYARIVYGMRHAPSFLEHSDPEDRLIIINSFSKPWAMTGWRLGWLITPKRFGKTLEMMNEFNFAGAATFTQMAGITALRHGEAFLTDQIKRYEDARDLVYERFSTHPKITMGWPEGAFYAFFSVAGMTNGLAFCRKLVQEARVGLVPGTTFAAPEEGWLRLCFANSLETLNTAIDRLEEHLDK